MKTVGESPIDPDNGDQADVQLSANLTDVRNASDLSDYTGELRAVLPLRITDRSAAPRGQLGTTNDVPLGFNIDCAATPGAEGGACNVATSADAVMTDLVSRRDSGAIWRLGQVQVFDGGADGDADTTGDNTLFAVQGVFTP